MDITAIVLIVFFLIAIPFGIWAGRRQISMDKVKFYGDEKIVYEEYPVNIVVTAGRRSYRPNSKIIITNYLMLLTQKILFRDKFALLYMIDYKTNKNEELRSSENKKYFNYMYVPLSNISFESRDKKDFVVILVPNDNLLTLFGKAYISFWIKDIQSIKKLVNG
ncbi:MAG: hypothetical protein HY279_13435 [Nitrospinae bacterium]|nr:hypothetical protein [Nitrospinota bacterium]